MTAILAVLAAFLLGWLFFFGAAARGKKGSPNPRLGNIPVPGPRVDSEAVESLGKELGTLGFRLIHSLDKSWYGLWPSPLQLYVHHDLPIFAELATIPGDVEQVQFITAFPDGSVTTLAGERRVTFKFLSGNDIFYWEPAEVSSGFERHIVHVRKFQDEARKAPIPPNLEAYLDFLFAVRKSAEKMAEEERLQPRTIYDYLILGYLLLLKGKEMEGLEMFQAAINIDPEQGTLHRDAGKISLYIGSDRLAVQYFYEAIELNPDDTDSRLLLGEILARLGKTDEALSRIERKIKD